MAITFKLITSLTVTSSSQSVFISGFPSSSTYDDFMLIARLKDSQNSGAFKFNGSTLFNNSTAVLQDSNYVGVTNTTLEGNTARGSTQMFYQTMTSSNEATNFSANTMYVAEYSRSIDPKPVIFDTSVSTNTMGTWRGMASALWQSTSAITRLDIYAGSQSIQVGSSLYLYGIKRA